MSKTYGNKQLFPVIVQALMSVYGRNEEKRHPVRSMLEGEYGRDPKKWHLVRRRLMSVYGRDEEKRHPVRSML